SPHSPITRARRRGETRSLTTLNPTEATAPRPTPASASVPSSASQVVAYVVAPTPAAHSRVPTISTRLRSERSPRYAHATAATAVISRLTATAEATAGSPTPRSSLIGLSSGGGSAIATLSSAASTMNTATV